MNKTANKIQRGERRTKKLINKNKKREIKRNNGRRIKVECNRERKK